MRLLVPLVALYLLAGCLGGCPPIAGDITWQQDGLYDAALAHPEGQALPAKGPAWNVQGQEVPLALVQVADQAVGRGHQPQHFLQPGNGSLWTLERVHAADFGQGALRQALAAFLESSGQVDADVEELLQRLDAERTPIATEFAGPGNGTAIFRSQATLQVDEARLRDATATATRVPSPEMPPPGRVTATGSNLTLTLSRAMVQVPVVVDGDEADLRVDAADRASLHGVPPDLGEEAQAAWLADRLAAAGLPDDGIKDVESQYAIC